MPNLHMYDVTSTDGTLTGATLITGRRPIVSLLVNGEVQEMGTIDRAAANGMLRAWRSMGYTIVRARGYKAIMVPAHTPREYHAEETNDDND